MLYNLSIQLNSVSNLRHGLQVTRLDAAPMWPLNWCAAIWQTTWFVQLIENYHLSNYYSNNITLYTWLGMLFFCCYIFQSYHFPTEHMESKVIRKQLSVICWGEQNWVDYWPFYLQLQQTAFFYGNLLKDNSSRHIINKTD